MKLIGGDTNVALAVPDLKEWEKTRDEGLTRFLLTTGLRRFGLPYAILAGAISAPFAHGGIISVGVQWAVAGALCGLIMGVLQWRTAERTFRAREAKRVQPPRRVG